MQQTKKTTKDNLDLTQINQKCVNFINEHTTIMCVADSNEDGMFWDGIYASGNSIIINLEIAHPGDLLHEAGHIATILLSSRTEIIDDMDFMPELHRLVNETKMPYGCDNAATGWAYAACTFLDIPNMLPFENGYENIEREYWACQVSSSKFGYPLKKLGLLSHSTNKWDMLAWDINLLNNYSK